MDTAFETRGNSRDPNSNASTFFQSFKIEPGLPAFDLPGLSVRASLSYLLKMEGYDEPLSGGKASSEYSFSVAGQDRYGHLQFGLGFNDRTSLQPGSTASILRGDESSSQTVSMMMAPPAGPTFTGSVSRSFSASTYAGRVASGSENVGGTMTMQYGLPHGTLRFTRSAGNSLTYPGYNHRASESTSFSFDHALVMPLGTFKTSYSFLESSNDFLVLPGGISTTQEEYASAGLEGAAPNGFMDYSAATEQRRTVAPDGTMSENQSQTFNAGFRIPLPKGGSGRAGMGIAFGQSSGPNQRLSTEVYSYSLGLQPLDNLSFGLSSSTRNTTDILNKARRNATSDISGSLNYQANPRFSIAASLAGNNGRDYTGDGSSASGDSYSVSANMSVNPSMSLSFQLGTSQSASRSSSIWGNSDDDAYFASANMNLRPSQQLYINAAFRSDAYHRHPGNRDIGQALSLAVGYALSDDVSWQFVYRGDDRWTREMPWTKNSGDTVQTSFTFRF